MEYNGIFEQNTWTGHIQDIEIFLEHCPVPALLPTAFNMPLGVMFANWDREEGFVLPYGG